MENVLRRDGRYSWRSRVPADIARITGLKQIFRTLGTADPRVARMEAARLSVQAFNTWAEVRSRMIGQTAEEVRQLVESLVDALRVSTAASSNRFGRRSGLLDGNELGHKSDPLEDAQRTLPALLQRISDAESQAGQTAKLVALADTMRPKALGELRELMGILDPRFSTKPTPKVLDYLTKTYVLEKRLREDANRHVVGYINLFARATGNKALAEYKRKDILGWVRVLEQLRTTYGKKKGDKEKSIAKLLGESQQETKLGRTTIEKHILHVKAFFISANIEHHWAPREQVEALFERVPLSMHVRSAKPRKSWTNEQLTELFMSPIWSGTRSRREDVTKRHQEGPQIHRDAYWWLPIVALWTGARLEELAQLQYDDLAVDKNGIHYINPDNGFQAIAR